MDFLTFHHGLKKVLKYLLAIIPTLVVGFFACNAYLRWQGIETGLGDSKEVHHGLNAHYYALCESAIVRDKKILEAVQCGIDSCFHIFYDLNGKQINAIDDYAGMGPERTQDTEDYVQNCSETTPEYFHRFVDPTKSSSSRVAAPSTHQLESKDLKILFDDALYSTNFDNGPAVQNYPPPDTGTESLGMTSSNDWIIKVNEGFVYEPFKEKCLSKLEKTTLGGRLLSLCQDGFDYDRFGKNMFVFDESSKAMIWIVGASFEARGAALDAIRGGLQWK